MKSITLGLTIAMILPLTAFAETTPVLIGDPINGAELYKKECAACHGDQGTGGRSGIALTNSGRLNLVQDKQMFFALKMGKGLKKPAEHTFKNKLKFLQIWDVVAYVRSLHMTLDQFFPTSARYVSKKYTIDKWGLERIKENAGKAPADKDAAVFTFFDFDGEEGNLNYVPQDPILLDQLKKDKKSGYLVFLPFKTKGFEGEIGVGMDAGGAITSMAVHKKAKGADLLNKSLSRFKGLGKKGQSQPFKIGGGKQMAKLAKEVFPVYLRAMETVTMYDREENERTWAD